MVLGEGAAILLLESERFAAAHGIPVCARVLGYGICADLYHMNDFSRSPGRMRREKYVQRAQQCTSAPEAVEHINAHGTDMPINDTVEIIANKRLFGKRSRLIPVSSVRSALGHRFGAAGGVEAAATILAPHQGILQPVVNLREPDPSCDLDYVPIKARAANIHVTLSSSFACGGNNTTLLFWER